MRSFVFAATLAVAGISPVLVTSASAATRPANAPVVVVAQDDAGATVLIQTARR